MDGYIDYTFFENFSFISLSNFSPPITEIVLPRLCFSGVVVKGYRALTKHKELKLIYVNQHRQLSFIARTSTTASMQNIPLLNKGIDVWNDLSEQYQKESSYDFSKKNYEKLFFTARFLQ
jgi:hypothetical protein